MKKLLLFCVLFGAYIVGFGQNFADVLNEAGPCDDFSLLTCQTGIENPNNAVDGNTNTFATMQSKVGVGLLLDNTAFLDVSFSTAGPAGTTIGLLIERPNQSLSLDLLQGLKVILFDEDNNPIDTINNISLQNAGLLSSSQSHERIEFVTEIGNYKIKRARIEFTGLVNISQRINIYGIYESANCPAVVANTVVNAISTQNPEFATDADPNSFALLNLPLSLGNAASLELGFEVPANPGDFVGFEVARDNLILSLGLLENISITALDAGGNELDSYTELNILDLVALDQLGTVLGPLIGASDDSNSNTIIGFNTSSNIGSPIASIRIEVAPLVGLAVDLAVFNGFYYSNSNALQVSSDLSGIVEGQTANLSATGNYESFSWSNGASGQNISVTTPGMYTVTGTRFDGCEISASILIRDLNCASGTTSSATQLIETGACDPQVALLCPSGVENPELAVDNDISTAAILSSSLGVNLIETQAFIEVGFERAVASGSQINFLFQPLNQLLNVDLVDNMAIELFDEDGNSIVRNESLGLQDLQVISGAQGPLNLISIPTNFGNYKIKSARLEIEAVLNLLQEVALYDVYAGCACPATLATEVTEFIRATDTGNLTDNDPNNYAKIELPLGLVMDGSITMRFAAEGLPGDYVGVVVGADNDLLSAGVIQNIVVDLIDPQGNIIVSNSDFTLADLIAAEQVAGSLGGLLGVSDGSVNPYVIGAVVPEGNVSVNQIKVTVSPTIGLLTVLRVYNGFVQPRIQGVTITSSSNEICTGGDAVLSAPAGYNQYLWSTGETTREISVSEPGLYSVNIPRANACNLFGSFEVADQGLDLSATVVEPNCNTNNGSASVTVTRGSGDYSYLWSNGSTESSINNITSGSYSVTVVDNETGCMGTLDLPISDVDAPKFAFWVRHANCGLGDGAIFLTLPSDAFIQWSTGQTTPIIRNLTPGFYTATVTFANGCKRIATYRVIDRTDFGLSADLIPSSCTDPTGAIDLTISVAGDYSFEWSNGATSEDLIGLAPGIYSVVVTNLASGCQDILELALSTEGAPTLTGLTLQEETCARQENGVIEIAVDALNPVTIEWNTGQTTSRIENLGPGFYTVKVRDEFGCEANGIFPLVARDSLESSSNSEPTFCNPPFNGAITTTTSGGRAPYNYIWNTGDITSDLTGLNLGTYSVIVTDFNGCAINLEQVVDRNDTCKSDPPGPDPENPIVEGIDDINNIFTPNTDGKNDLWVTGLDLSSFDQVAVKIVNIYGTLVYSSNQYLDDWNGTFKASGDPVPDGAYYYNIELTRGSERKNLVSYVMIKR